MDQLKTFLKRAILFDLDGVLVDSTIPVEKGWHDWAKRQGLDPEQVVRAAHGRRTIETVREFAPSSNVEAEAAALDHAEAEDLEGLHIIPGAAELIAQMPEERWGICTSGTNEVATARLRFVGLPVPRVLISSEMVSKGKPDPAPYFETAKQLGYRAADCLVIEDSPAGTLAGKRTGADVIGVTTTYSVRDLERADAIVSDLRSIMVTPEGDWLRIKISAMARN